MDKNKLIDLVNLLELNLEALVTPIADGMSDEYFSETMYIVDIIRDNIDNIKQELV